MPIYEYQCHSCDATCDFLQKFSDPAKTDCPNCGERALTKMISASSFHLKGSGWYKTDFANKGQENKTTEQPKEAPTETKTTAETKEKKATKETAKKPNKDT